jgi:hypothetical protein
MNKKNINTVYPYRIGELYTLDFISKHFSGKKDDYYYNNYNIKRANEFIEFFREELSTLPATIFVNINSRVHKHIAAIAVVRFPVIQDTREHLDARDEVFEKLRKVDLANSSGTYTDPRNLSQVYRCEHKQYGFKIKPETQKHFGDILDV